MEALWQLAHKIYDVESLVRVGGLAGSTTIVFVETGLLIFLSLLPVIIKLARERIKR